MVTFNRGLKLLGLFLYVEGLSLKLKWRNFFIKNLSVFKDLECVVGLTEKQLYPCAQILGYTGT